jgi:hypothetical protein
MLDLHQGFSGRELEELAPTVTSYAVVQLDAATAMARRQWRRAVRDQVAAWKLLGRVVWKGVRERMIR